MDDGSAFAWVAVFAVVSIASIAQAVSGFGFALIATPVVAVVIGPEEAVVGLTIVGVGLVAQLAVRGRGSVERRAVATITASGVVGMPIGVLVLARAGDRALTSLIAVAVIVLTLLLWRGLRLPAGRFTDVAAGLVAGTLSTSTGTSGPPLVIALTSKSLAPAAFRATISAIFLVQGAISLVVFALAGQYSRDTFLVAAAALPGVVLGSMLGERWFRRLDERVFGRLVLAMLMLSGLLALAGAIVG